MRAGSLIRTNENCTSIPSGILRLILVEGTAQSSWYSIIMDETGKVKRWGVVEYMNDVVE